MLLVAVDRQDALAASQAMTDLLDSPPGLDDRAFERDVGQLIMRFGAGTGQAATMFVHLLRLVLRHGLSVPPSVAAAFRSLGALEGTLRLLSPEVDLVTVARTRGREAVATRITPEGVRGELTDQLATLIPLLQRLPRRLSEPGRGPPRRRAHGDRADAPGPWRATVPHRPGPAGRAGAARRHHRDLRRAPRAGRPGPDGWPATST